MPLKAKPMALLSPPSPFDQDPMLCKLFKLMQAHRNVLLIGGHGIGKTFITLSLAEWSGLRIKHMNAATLDPYADLAGIPVVDVQKRLVEFIHDMDLDRYDIFFIDEINRPGHTKVLNGLLELVQFMSVQGRKFKRLKMCWAAMNPPNQNYNVDDLDPTLLDRFHHYFDLPSVYSLPFFEYKFGSAMAQILVKWAIELDASKRMAITPRRLEYIGQAIRLFNNDTEMIASSVMSGTVQPQDFKILTMRMAPIFGNTDVTNTKTSAKINGMLQTQLELNKDALARAIEMAQGNVNT
jgi:hypothetical protein